ncbi:rod shape-determining protein MreC [Cytobacillus sp. S13-E01]|uniref:rod shape-determining protein MreC n=1 Tax=Cytobacillus sp. S13-E01 TaxID=3031326 RepID=UPI0023D7CE79|nr:rod shape-determining protein MreC [Cytobacillus sp. S13-E01]MDF0726768.1 rod shape-determining protein MreC [Cytobacillus sp. S13-E01]
MPQFFLNKRLILLLVSIIVLVALIGFSLKDREGLTWPEQFVKDTTGWVQSIIHTPARSISQFFSNVNDIKNTYEENKILKSKLDEYVKLETELQDLKDDYKILQEILDKTESLRDYEPIQASIIARNPDRWQELITINKGGQHGVKADMAVITAKGLIGKVKYTSQFTSTIQLLSAPDRMNRISAFVQGDGSKVFGLIEGYDEQKEALLLKRIPFDAKVEIKQQVLTSGLGEVFPEGLLVGEVIEVVPDDYGLTKTAYIKPAADFYQIDHVIVVERTMISKEEEEEES